MVYRAVLFVKYVPPWVDSFFLITLSVWGPCTMSSTTHWWPSMSMRTFAGGKTPMGPACPLTGLTSRYFSQCQSPTISVTQKAWKFNSCFSSKYFIQMFVGMDAWEEKQKREERSRKERNNREEVSKFIQKKTFLCKFVSTVIWSWVSVAAQLIECPSVSFVFPFVPLVWWLEEWE